MADVVKRDACERAIMKIATFIDNVESDDYDEEEIIVRNVSLNQQWQKFLSNHESVIGRTGPQGIEYENSVMDRMEDVFYRTSAQISKLLSNKKQSSEPDPITAYQARLSTLAQLIINVETYAREDAQTAEEGALISQTQHLKNLYAQYEQVLFQCIDITNDDHDLLINQGIVHTHFTSASALLFSAGARFRNQHLGNAVNHAGEHNSAALPKLEPPSFDGNVYGWEDFRDLFKSAVHERTELSNVRKLQYLKNCMKGEASNLLRNYKLTDENYEIAWNFLVSLFDDKKVLVHKYFQLLSDMPLCQESAEDLQKLLRTTNESIRGLQNLGRPIEHWDDWFVFHAVIRLDAESRRLWEQSQCSEIDHPKWDTLNTFIQGRIRAIISTPSLQKKPVFTINKPVNKSTSHTNQSNSRGYVKSHQSSVETKFNKKCSICEKPYHLIAFCQQFRRLNVHERRDICKQKKLCFNCMRNNHSASDCPSEKRCLKCDERHNTMLHVQPPLANPCSDAQATAQAPVVNMHTKEICHKGVLLATAMVNVRSFDGTMISMRALLDQGSQASFISESVAQTLRLPRIRTNISVIGLGATDAGYARSSIDLQISAPNGSATNVEVTALVIRSITRLNAITTSDKCNWSHLQGLKLADPRYFEQDKVDLLLGADVYSRILLGDVRQGPMGSPTAQSTSLGWILSGLISGPASKIIINPPLHCGLTLEHTLQKFWEIEEVSTARLLTTEEEECERFYEKTYKRNSEGRFIVRLPFVNQECILGSTYNSAVRRQQQMEKRFATNPSFAARYADFMQQYEDLKHMEDVPDHTNLDGTYYIPHHAVLNESSSTTKLRVVFDASHQSTNGRSLNEQLYPGPQLQQELTSIVMRWRKHAVVFTADVEKMFRQILVDPKDCDKQRVLWRKSPDQTMQHKRLLTVTYGTTCASYLSIKTLRQLALLEKDTFVIGSSVALSDFYVDDVLTGQDSVESALKAQTELIDLLKQGGFTLKKWSSNREELLEHLPKDYLECSFPLDMSKDESIKTLGIYWNPATDDFSFRSTLPPLTTTPTKRNLLADVARLYDPLGWLAPTIILAKIMFQNLWRTEANWDDPLTDELSSAWLTFRDDLRHLQNIRISRWLGNHSTQVSCQIHGFCDASMSAYAAVVYVRVVTSDGTTKVSLLTSKTKVAPIKAISLPRLELCGAVLLAQLLKKVHTAMDFKNVDTFAWTDSTIVLSWLAGHPTRWNIFVSNRVTEIQRTLRIEQWNHVPSESNPADCASRGVPPNQLHSHFLWWTGPDFLLLSSDSWPKLHHVSETNEESRKRVICSMKTIIHINFQMIENYSSLSKLLRVTSYCLRFVNNMRKPLSLRKIGFLTPLELDASLLFWVKITQECNYSDEISRLSKHSNISKASKLVRLTPIVGTDGILRVGGRLCNAKMNYNEQHPMILPKSSKLTSLLIADAHKTTLHGGTQQTLGYLQRRFWIVDARNQVRHFIHKCIVCFRQRGVTEHQIMANLPPARVTAFRPFLHTSIDYSGFFKVRSAKGRGMHATKAYIAVFVCLSTKAIHLELVSDLTTSAFLAAFKRFTSRRGICSDVYSDNGTNFVGAYHNLQKDFAKAQKSIIINTLSSNGTEWHFSPPLSPHFNGLVESGVRSVKHHIKRVVGESTLTFEEFYTVLTQIEACLNSRPLYQLTSDPKDLSALTPGHFLIGEAINTVPNPNLLEVRENHLTRWQVVQRMYQHFWTRWSQEYFHQLYQRSKWNFARPDLHIGNIVLIKDENQPPCKWSLGRIIETHPGKDGHIRVVTVRTQHSTFKRAIVKLALLPIKDNIE